jgi:hypothetical protein
MRLNRSSACGCGLQDVQVFATNGPKQDSTNFMPEIRILRSSANRFNDVSVDQGLRTSAPRDKALAKGALQALNFFMADMQAGIGPFLGVFLQQRGWTSGPIVTVMTVGGVAGMIITVPAGAFIAHTEKKRLIVMVSGICTAMASFLILLSQSA